MYATIVVGTDDSPTAREAVRQASEIAQAFTARLIVVCAYPSISKEAVFAAMPAGAGMLATPEVAEAAEAERDRCEAMLRDVVGNLDRRGIKVEGQAVAGDPASAIIDTAEREHADLVVVGSKGMSGAKRFLLGSVPNKVSHHTPCNLLIVHTC
jgi:nucleotide-binding universal stress UspA family protein